MALHIHTKQYLASSIERIGIAAERMLLDDVTTATDTTAVEALILAYQGWYNAVQAMTPSKSMEFKVRDLDTTGRGPELIAVWNKAMNHLTKLATLYDVEISVTK